MDPAADETTPLDAESGEIVYQHARWLVDGQHARLASIESRAATLIGWASAEIALTAIVAPLVAGALDGWQLAVVIVLLAFGGGLAAVGAICALRNIVSTSSVPAVEVDFIETVEAAARRRSDDTPALLIDRFQGSIVTPAADGTDAVLPSLKSEVSTRAIALRSAVGWQARALAVQGLALAALAIFLIQKGLA